MANVKIYSLKVDGEKKVSENFKVKEFRCKDGTDTVKIDLDNVKKLQKIRDHFGKSITITSSYRTPAHNKAIGSTSGSYHIKGQATDIVVANVDAFKVYLYADSISPSSTGGVIYYPNKKFCHVDTRPYKFRAITLDSKTYMTEPSVTLKLGSKNSSVKWMQYMLNKAGFKMTVDGSFGSTTELVVKKFQAKYGLKADGSFGPKSLAKLKEVLMK